MRVSRCGIRPPTAIDAAESSAAEGWTRVRTVAATKTAIAALLDTAGSIGESMTQLLSANQEPAEFPATSTFTLNFPQFGRILYMQTNLSAALCAIRVAER